MLIFLKEEEILEFKVTFILRRKIAFYSALIRFNKVVCYLFMSLEFV